MTASAEFGILLIIKDCTHIYDSS